jgi:hypothetical protein
MPQAKRHALSTLVVVFYAVLVIGTSKSTTPPSAKPAAPRSSTSASSPAAGGSTAGQRVASRAPVALEPGIVVRGALEPSDPQVYSSPADVYRLSFQAGRVYTIDLRPIGWEKHMPCFEGGAFEKLHLEYEIYEGMPRGARTRELIRFLESDPRELPAGDGLSLTGAVYRSRLRPATTGDYSLLVYTAVTRFGGKVSGKRPMTGDYEVRLYDREMPLRGTHDPCYFALPEP